jgi:ppGpp synthetase/RelA/SpoT-type nucleotidyltranferase
MTTPESDFDFQAHQQNAFAEYLKVLSFYQRFAAVMRQIVEAAIAHRDIKVQSVQARAKDPASFRTKAARPSDEDPRKPKYPSPLVQISDLVGVRIIAYFPETLLRVDRLLKEEFDITERSDKGAELIEDERFGYQSIHYLVRLAPGRVVLAEYSDFQGIIAEIQVRTILQHAWAEIEHDIQYKSISIIPQETRRRFMSLAGLLEIADREFQAIQEDDSRTKERARSQVQAGNLQEVEITPDALRAFLDKKLGNDGRISEVAYSWYAKLLKQLGFRTLQQVDYCIRGYDDDNLSRIATGGRQGQTSRFELMLLAGMSNKYIERHNHTENLHFLEVSRGYLEDFKNEGVEVREYDPVAPQSSAPGH